MNDLLVGSGGYGFNGVTDDNKRAAKEASLPPTGFHFLNGCFKHIQSGLQVSDSHLLSVGSIRFDRDGLDTPASSGDIGDFAFELKGSQHRGHSILVVLGITTVNEHGQLSS
jgi:hypothetical protein